ncbi:MAG: exodeoxyribonuclease VII large subunit [Tahibacter sp.]
MSEDSAGYSSVREVYTPSTLTRDVRDLLEDRYAMIWLDGELSNFSRPASGHLYFSLKDTSAQVRCAMFKPRSTWLKFRPADGMHVLIRARVSLYEARGEFQLIVEHMEEAGAGALQREFEQLKARLGAEGLFDAARKRPLPSLPRRIGVITSPSGAAVRDVISVLRRRFALVDVEILPVPVQGREAPAAIAAMIALASRAGRYDVLLLTRGGGSIEDLWAFNDEAVARAIYASAIPLVAAIGHETDVTIADFVADLRAATPSAAAELLVPESLDLQRTLLHRRQRLTLLAQRHRERLAQRLDRLRLRLDAMRPQTRLDLGRARLDGLQRRLQHARARDAHRLDQRMLALQGRLRAAHPGLRIDHARQESLGLKNRLVRSGVVGLQQRAAQVAELARALNAVSPLATLARGYAILFDAESGRIIRSAGEVEPGQSLRARLADGELRLRATPDDE